MKTLKPARTTVRSGGHKNKRVVVFDLISAVPQLFEGYFSAGMLLKAQKIKAIKIKIHNLHDFGVDKRGSVDDTPYGGGAGMVLRVEPIYNALVKIKRSKKQTNFKTQKSKFKTRTILFSAAGKTLKQSDLVRL